MQKIFRQFFIILLLMFSTHLRAQNQLEGGLFSQGGYWGG